MHHSLPFLLILVCKEVVGNILTVAFQLIKEHWLCPEECSQIWQAHDTTAAPPMTHTCGTLTASDTLREAAAKALQDLIYSGLQLMSGDDEADA